MKEKDFVIATQRVNGIDINSVGIIKSTFQEEAQVYFVGKNEDIIAPFNSLRVIDVNKTGDEHLYKVCNICHILKPTTEAFAKNQNAKGDKPRRRPSCKVCRKGIDGKKMSASEERRMNAKRPQDKTVFVCPICEKRSIVDITVTIRRDHDHNTGTGREWICDSCNTGLGRFKDDITILETAIEYLKHFEDDESEDSDSMSQVGLFES